MCFSTTTRIVRMLDTTPMSCAILDNDQEYLTHLDKVLDDLGFSVSSFLNGNDFVQEYKSRRFDVVVVSWDIQPTSGGMVVESIRHRGGPYPSLVVACDGGASVSFQLALSPAGFLFKPYSAQQLMDVLEKAVRIRNELS